MTFASDVTTNMTLTTLTPLTMMTSRVSTDRINRQSFRSQLLSLPIVIIIVLISVLLLLILSPPCDAFQVTLLDTTKMDSLDWTTHSSGDNQARRGWREASYTAEQGDVVRVYTVCNVAVHSVDNWLRTPFIQTGDANRLYVDVRFSMRQCTKYPDPVRLQQCKESIKLLVYEADSDFANSMMPTWDEETYRHVDVIAADKVFTHINAAVINAETRSIPVTRRGVYFAFYDQGSCATLISVRVYYVACPAVTLRLAAFENTTTGPDLSSIVHRQGVCVDHAVLERQAPSYLCKGDGSWYFLTGGCVCAPGYSPNSDEEDEMTLCVACPAGSFKSLADNSACRSCPPRSSSPKTGSVLCSCDEGFYRASRADSSTACYKPPIEVENLAVTYMDHSTVTLAWTAPVAAEVGGLVDVRYRIECIGCDGRVFYKPHQTGLNGTSVTLSGLTGGTQYKIIVYSENGVSRAAGRTSAATILVTTDPTVPFKISNVRVISVGTDYISLSWDTQQLSGINIDLFEVRGRTVAGWGEFSETIQATTGHISHYQADSPVVIIIGSAVAVVICMIIVVIMIAVFVKREGSNCREKHIVDCDMLGNAAGHYPLELNGTLVIDSRLTIPLFAGSGSGSYKTYIDPHAYEDPARAIREFTKEIDASCITIESVIGGGEFGDVCMGRLAIPGRAELIVAIKTLKSGASDKNRLDFLTEASIMGQFDDPNVIYLEGVVTRTSPVMIVTEYMENGSLDTFLRRNDGNYTIIQLIGMIRGIASGMCYLSNMGYVHRDLAARNILVNSSLVCKVADFGLSREMENDNNDCVYTTKGGKIPVRWTAPEAIAYRKFTSASDVWSYGVVMWEVMSYGERPYWNWSNQDVIKAIDNDYRLLPPMDCPEAVYQMMVDCWHKERSQRPKFVEIVKSLDKLIRAPELLRTLAKSRCQLSLSKSSDKMASRCYDTVEQWLLDIKMNRYAVNFLSGGYTEMDDVLRLTRKDLVGLGIELVGHQKKILDSVYALRARAINDADAGLTEGLLA